MTRARFHEVIIILMVCLLACSCARSKLAAASSINLVQNGNFEIGLQGWSSYTWGVDYPTGEKVNSLDVRVERVKAADAPSGSYVMALNAPVNLNFSIASRMYEVSPGQFQFTAAVKAPDKVSVRVVDADKPAFSTTDSVLASTDIGPTTGWQRIQFDVKVPKDVKFIAVWIRGTGSGEYEFDDFHLTPTVNNGNYKYCPVDAGFESQGSDGIYFAGQKQDFVLRAFSAQPTSGQLKYRIENAWGDEVKSGNIDMKLPAGRVVEEPFNPDLDKTGHYRIVSQFEVARKSQSCISETLFAVIPSRVLATSPESGKDSHFGCEMDDVPFLIKVGQDLGIRWVACSPPLFTHWFDAEPTKGAWTFYDSVVDAYGKAGINLAGNLADPPAWAVNPGSTAAAAWPNPDFPRDMTDWDAYVQKVVSHYSPRISYWTLWNEPNHPVFLHLNEGENWASKYRSLQDRTYKTLKQVNPNLQLVGGTVTNPGALVQLIDDGGLDCLSTMDTAAFHWSSWTSQGYVKLTGEELGELGPKETSNNCIELITDAMKTAGKTVPLWDTECHMTEATIEREFITQPTPPNGQGTPAMTRLDAAAAIPRQYVTEWAAGVDKTFYWLLAFYESSWEPRNSKTLLEWDRSPTAALVTYAVTTNMLDGAKFVKLEKKVDTESIDRTTFWTFYFQTPKGNLRVVWSDSDTPREMLVPVESKNVEVYDMFGVECPGTQSMSAVDLQGKVLLQVGRCPYYVLEKD